MLVAISVLVACARADLSQSEPPMAGFAGAGQAAASGSAGQDAVAPDGEAGAGAIGGSAGAEAGSDSGGGAGADPADGASGDAEEGGGAGGGGVGGSAGNAGQAGAGGTGGSAGSSCLSYSNGFDTAAQAAEWTAGSTQAGTQWGQFSHHWAWGKPSVGPKSDHSGSGSLWGNRLSSKYYFFENSHLQSPVWDLAKVTSATLSFWHWLELEWCTSGCGAGNPVPTALDGANVVCWNGTDWQLAGPAGGYPGIVRMFDSAISPQHPMKGQPGFKFAPSEPGFSPAWRLVSIPLPVACLRSDAKVRFRFGSDSSDASMNGQGWHVDDVSLTAICP
jgi:hypothetical protein